jgi:hypothetical protein
MTMVLPAWRRWLHKVHRWYCDREALLFEIKALERRLKFRGVGVKTGMRSISAMTGRPVSAVIDDRYPLDKRDPSMFWTQVRVELHKCMDERSLRG